MHVVGVAAAALLAFHAVTAALSSMYHARYAARECKPARAAVADLMEKLDTASRPAEAAASEGPSVHSTDACRPTLDAPEEQSDSFGQPALDASNRVGDGDIDPDGENDDSGDDGTATDTAADAREQTRVTFYSYVRQREISVTFTACEAVSGGLEALFDVYCRCFASSSAGDELLDSVVDAWNALAGYLNAKAQLRAAMQTVDSSDDAELTELRVYFGLLAPHCRYDVRRRVASDAPYAVTSLDTAALRTCIAQDRAGASVWRTARALWDSVWRLCDRYVAASIAGSFLFQSSLLHWLLPTGIIDENLTPVAPLAEQLGSYGRPVSVLTFWRDALSGTTGKLLFGALASRVLMMALYGAKTHFSNHVLRTINRAVYLDAVMCLARQDYSPDTPWAPARHVRFAVRTAAELSLMDFDSVFGDALSKLQLAATVLRFPRELAASAVGDAAVEYSRQCWSRLSCLRNLLRQPREEPPQLPTGDASQGDRARRETSRPPSTAASTALLGLSTLVAAAAAVSEGSEGTAPPALATLRAQKLAFPLEPTAAVSTISVPACRAALQGCRAAGQDDTALAQCLADLTELSEELPPLTAEERKVFASCEAVLFLWREAGLAAPPPQSVTPSATSVGTAQDAADVAGDVFFACLQPLPTILCVEAARTAAADPHPRHTRDVASLTEGMLAVGAELDLFPSPYLPRAGVAPHEYERAILEERLATYDYIGGYARAMRYLGQLRDTPPRIDRLPFSRCVPLERGPWSLEFREVSLRYPGASACALRGVSFRVEAGQMLGIIGFSGAGKTSLLQLVSRVYEPTAGAILLNGRPIQCYAARDLRRRLGNAWQESSDMRFLPRLSIEDQVALGDPLSATAEGVREALRRAEALAFVTSRAQGVREVLRPSQLSGGEVERLHVARTLMRCGDACGLYLLDEITSALDSVTEQRILVNAGLAPGTARSATVLMVTHRLASIRAADTIVVLRDGAVSERGTWEQLCALPPDSSFQKLLEAQKYSAPLP